MSKFEQYLAEWNKEKEWDEPNDSGSNHWSVIKSNPDGKGFKIVKQFKNHEKKQAQSMADSCNKKYNTKKYSVLETA